MTIFSSGKRTGVTLHNPANVFLSDARDYHEERKDMANPKGWEHVLLVFNRVYGSGRYGSHGERIDHCRKVLSRLVRLETLQKDEERKNLLSKGIAIVWCGDLNVHNPHVHGEHFCLAVRTNHDNPRTPDEGSFAFYLVNAAQAKHLKYAPQYASIASDSLSELRALQLDVPFKTTIFSLDGKRRDDTKHYPAAPGYKPDTERVRAAWMARTGLNYQERIESEIGFDEWLADVRAGKA